MRVLPRRSEGRGSWRRTAAVAAVRGAVVVALVVAAGARRAHPPATRTLVAVDAEHATVALDPDGHAVVAWVGVHEGAAAIYVARVEGDVVGTPVRLTEAGDRLAIHSQAPPQVRTGPHGEVYVAWQTSEAVEGRRFPAGHVRLARSSDGGRTFEPSRRVGEPDDGPPTSNGFHDMAVAPDGTVFVSWIAGGGPDVRVARSLDGGRSFETPVVVDRVPCPCCRTALAIGPDGSVHVAWRKQFDDGSRDVVVASSTDGGGSFGTPVPAHHDGWAIDACPHAGPAVAVDATGRVHVAWFTGADGRAGVHYVRSGTAELQPVRPTALTELGIPTSQVRMVRAGPGVWAAWEQPNHAGSATVRVARLDGPRPRPLRMPITTGRSPAIATRAGLLAVVWNDGGAVYLATAALRSPRVARSDSRMSFSGNPAAPPCLLGRGEISGSDCHQNSWT
jgi:hypothetical protein